MGGGMRRFYLVSAIEPCSQAVKVSMHRA